MFFRLRRGADFVRPGKRRTKFFITLVQEKGKACVLPGSSNMAMISGGRAGPSKGRAIRRKSLPTSKPYDLTEDDLSSIVDIGNIDNLAEIQEEGLELPQPAATSVDRSQESRRMQEAKGTADASFMKKTENAKERIKTAVTTFNTKRKKASEAQLAKIRGLEKELSSLMSKIYEKNRIFTDNDSRTVTQARTEFSTMKSAILQKRSTAKRMEEDLKTSTRSWARALREMVRSDPSARDIYDDDDDVYF